MKAEKTRNFMNCNWLKEALPNLGIWQVVQVNKELDELERLAEIGRATEKAFKEFVNIEAISYTDIGKINTFAFQSVEELIDWATQEGKTGEDEAGGRKG